MSSCRDPAAPWRTGPAPLSGGAGTGG